MTQYIISTADSNGHALSLATRVQQALVPAELRKTSLLSGLPDVEIALTEVRALLDEASRLPGATADTIVEAAITSTAAITRATSDITSNGAPGGPDGAGALTGQVATQQALLHPSFLSLATALAPLSATTGAERRNILLSAAKSRCVIAIQVLVAGTRALARLHPALGKILDSRSELSSYFGKAMTMDLTFPFAIHERHRTFTWTGERGDETYAMGLFLNLAFRSMDFMNGPVGINALRALMLGPNQPRSYTHPLDFYTTERGVTSLCLMLHRLLLAIGAPDIVLIAIGFTMVTWGEFYILHIMRACELGTLEDQVRWLDFAANQFCLFLTVVETSVRQWVYSTQPGPATLATIAPWDCPPAVALRNMCKDLTAINLDADRRSWGVLDRPKGTLPHVDDLPKLSAYPHLVVHFHPPDSAEPPPAAAKRPLPAAKTPTVTPKAKVPKTTAAKPPAKPKGSPSTTATAWAPGTHVNTWKWLKMNSLLLMGAWVWDVGAIVRNLKIAGPNSLCWAMLLSKRIGSSLRALYPAGNQAADAFVLNPLVTPNDNAFRNKYARMATTAEKAQVTQQTQPTPNGKGRRNFRQSA